MTSLFLYRFWLDQHGLDESRQILREAKNIARIHMWSRYRRGACFIESYMYIESHVILFVSNHRTRCVVMQCLILLLGTSLEALPGLLINTYWLALRTPPLALLSSTHPNSSRLWIPSLCEKVDR